MEIFQIVGLGLTAVVFFLVLEKDYKQFSLQLVIAFGVLVFLLMMDKIVAVFQVLEDLALRADVNLMYITTIFKIVGIAYIAEFGAQVCRDGGSQAIAGKIEFAAKIIITVLAIPILIAILDAIIQLIP